MQKQENYVLITVDRQSNFWYQSLFQKNEKYRYEPKLMYMIQTKCKPDGKIYAETKTNRDIKPYSLVKPNNTR